MAMTDPTWSRPSRPRSRSTADPRQDHQGPWLRASRAGIARRSTEASLPPIDLGVVDPRNRSRLPVRRAASRRPTPTSSPRSSIRLAEADARICAITAGMPTGTGLSAFQERFPRRFFDVGIAEQHAVTMATGLALAGMRPVVAIYSTFSQRAFDQLVHDVCQNDAPVLLAIDRAGLVGEDGRATRGCSPYPPSAAEPGHRLAQGRAGAARPGGDRHGPRRTDHPALSPGCGRGPPRPPGPGARDRGGRGARDGIRPAAGGLRPDRPATATSRPRARRWGCPRP